MYQMYPEGSPRSAETDVPIADITGTDQKDRPYPQESI